MSKTKKITSIIFRRTSNIFINAGIVSIYHYLDRCQNDDADEDDFPEYDFDFIENGNALEIKSEHLFELLEKVYYFMGKEVYDTTGKKSRQKADKYYFTNNPFSATPFYKMKTYGLAALITNDAQPSPKGKNNAAKFSDLLKHDEEFANEIANFYKKHDFKLKFYDFNDEGLVENPNAKGDSKIFLNEPYIKITRLDPIQAKYFEEGTQTCYLTNEKYSKLVAVQNTVPFIKGIGNFTSHFTPGNLKVSWKAMYAIRFSPKLFFYSYVKGLNSIVCFGYDSDSLENLHTKYTQYRSMYFTSSELIDSNYMKNFKVTSFKQKSANEEEMDAPNDYVWKSELLFMLIFTMYKRFLIDSKWEDETISLVGFRADDFSGTLRPKEFEYFNNFKFVIRIIKYLEKEKVNLQKVLRSLKINNDDYQLARKFRSEILDNLLHGKSILPNMARFYSECYRKNLSNKQSGFKDYKQLTNFTLKYEYLINKLMDKELQKKAFNLGMSIGYRISKAGDGSDRDKAKFGRKYIIHLQKARTLDQFNDAIIRIQNKYQLQVSGDLFKENINEENFLLIKQFATIGALNKLNSILNPIKDKKDEKK